jgi:hypothetical protein
MKFKNQDGKLNLTFTVDGVWNVDKLTHSRLETELTTRRAKTNIQIRSMFEMLRAACWFLTRRQYHSFTCTNITEY